MSIDAYQGPQYSQSILRKNTLNDCPFEQFSIWYSEAEKECSGYANPVSLATVSSEGQPVVRTVLLKGQDKQGFRFYTNYQSRKGKHLSANPKTSMCFYWEELERQVIVIGAVEKLSAEESDNYFATRLRGSQIGAHVSSQSQLIDNREELQAEMQRLEEQYADTQIPRPDHWGGFILIPESIEFWQGQPDRLHDRLIYTRSGDKSSWTINRLAP